METWRGKYDGKEREGEVPLCGTRASGTKRTGNSKERGKKRRSGGQVEGGMTRSGEHTATIRTCSESRLSARNKNNGKKGDGRKKSQLVGRGGSFSQEGELVHLQKGERNGGKGRGKKSPRQNRPSGGRRKKNRSLI